MEYFHSLSFMVAHQEKRGVGTNFWTDFMFKSEHELLGDRNYIAGHGRWMKVPHSHETATWGMRDKQLLCGVKFWGKGEMFSVDFYKVFMCHVSPLKSTAKFSDTFKVFWWQNGSGLIAASLVRDMPRERSGIGGLMCLLEKKYIHTNGFTWSSQCQEDGFCNPRTCQRWKI